MSALKKAIVFVNLSTSRDQDFIDYVRMHYPGLHIISLVTNSSLLTTEQTSPHKTGKIVHASCDVVLQASTLEDAISQLQHSSYEIKAVIPATEMGVEAADHIADYFGLHCNTPKTTAARRNKSVMKEYAQNAGLRCADYAQCYTAHDIIQFAKKNGYPIVLKTPEGVASVDVFICHDEKTALERLTHILHNTDSPYILAEEYLDGTEYVVDLFADGQTIHATNIWRYVKTSNSVADNIYRETILEDITDPTFKPLVTYAKALAKAVGVRVGAAHAEIKICKGEPIMIEIGSRLAGGMMPSLIAQTSNFNPFHHTVEVYLHGQTLLPEVITFHRYTRIIHCSHDQTGIVHEIQGLDSIQMRTSYHSHKQQVHIGDYVTPTEHLWTIPLTVYLMHEKKEQLQHDAAHILNTFALHITSNKQHVA